MEARRAPFAAPLSSWHRRYANLDDLRVLWCQLLEQILLEQRYGRAVDWWAFGVLMYEMLLGQSPFRGDDEDEIFDAILEDEPLYPITMPREAVSILQKVCQVGIWGKRISLTTLAGQLLTRDPNRRLGSGKSDAEEIKAHPFFRDVNWDDVMKKRIPPPYCPTIVRTLLLRYELIIRLINSAQQKGSADTSNFDEEFTREQPTLTPVHTQLSAQDQNEFQGFSWVYIRLDLIFFAASICSPLSAGRFVGRHVSIVRKRLTNGRVSVSRLCPMCQQCTKFLCLPVIICIYHFL